MSTYSCIVKKGKYELSVATTDRELVEEQFKLWVKQASEYALKKKANEGRIIAENKIAEERKITEQNIAKQLASTNEEKVDTIPDIKPSVAKKEEPKSEQKQSVSNSDLDIFYAPPAQQAYKETISDIVREDEAKPVFDNILEKSIQNPTTELSFKPSPSIKKDSAFINYISTRKVEKNIDYLLLTAYYFSQFEQMPRFTLKQLNAKLMQNIAVIIDHAVIQEAINRDYIECLPDLTGVVGASEYRLTAYGEKVLLND